jgi:hypothetical protein
LKSTLSREPALLLEVVALVVLLAVALLVVSGAL